MRTLASWEWVLYLAILPIVTFPSLFEKWLSAIALILLALSWLVRKLASGHFFPATPLDWTLVLLSLMILISLWATPVIDFSLPKAIRVVYGIAVLYAVVFFVRKERQRLYWVTAFLLVVGVGISAVGLLGTSWTAKLSLAVRVSRFLPQGLISMPGIQGGLNPNEVAGVLLLAAPLAFGISTAALIRTLQKGRQVTWQTLGILIFSGAAAIILGGTIVLTQSRGAYIGFAAGLFLIIIATLWKRRWLAAALLIVAGIGVVLAAQTMGQGFSKAPFETPAEDLIGASSIETLALREEIWVRAIYGIEDFSLTGMGLNTFRLLAPILYPPLGLLPDSDIAHAHNQFLQAGVDLGIPGLIAYSALWLGAVGLLWFSWRAAEDFWLRVLALGFSGSLAAYFVFGLVDAVALGARPGFLFWLLLGLVTSLHAVVNWRLKEEQVEDLRLKSQSLQATPVQNT